MFIVLHDFGTLVAAVRACFARVSNTSMYVLVLLEFQNGGGSFKDSKL